MHSHTIFRADRIFLFLELDIKAAIKISAHISEAELKTMYPVAKLVKTHHIPEYEDKRVKGALGDFVPGP